MTPALPRTPGIVAGWYGPQWEARWRLTADLLEHLIGMLRAIREPPELFIAFVPSPFQVHESFQRTVAAGAASDERYAAFPSDPDRPQRLLEALARRLEMPFIDLTPALRRSASDRELRGPFIKAGSNRPAANGGRAYQVPVAACRCR